MEGKQFELDALFYAMRELAGRSLPVLVPVWLVLFGSGLLFDYYLPDVPGAQLIVGIGQFVLSYFLAKGLARHAGLLQEHEVGPGFGAYFGLSFMLGLGQSLAYLALVLPGIYLSIRWLLAFPVLFSPEDYDGGRGALGTSWDLTGPVFWKLAPPFLVSIVLMVITFFTAVASVDDSGVGSVIGMLVLANAVAATNSVYLLVLGFAAFLLLRNDRSQLAEIFA